MSRQMESLVLSNELSEEFFEIPENPEIEFQPFSKRPNIEGEV